MARFEAYLLEIQRRGGMEPLNLIRAWESGEAASVGAVIGSAVRTSGIIGSTIPSFVGTNQARGNKAADHFVAVVPRFLRSPNRIDAATGAGYPDRVFRSADQGYFMELKATSNWRNVDANRRVLTSAPDKMRRLVSSGLVGSPPAHIICTVLYNEETAIVTGVRIDFLEPGSEVNIRLEASTSQRLLSQGSHHKLTIP